MLLTWALATHAAGPLNPADFPVLAEELRVDSATIDTEAMTFEGYRGAEFDGAIVFTFGGLLIEGDLVIEGPRPVALLSTGDLVVRGKIDISAYDQEPGPGGFAPQNRDDGNGPGGGLSFDTGTGAGHCGQGGATENGIRPGGTIYDELQRGLVGGSGGGSTADYGGGDGGAGGGAIELGALGRLIIRGAILANGGAARDANNRPSGGGGSGGRILLHGGADSRCNPSAVIRARGGKGGDSLNFEAGGGGGAGCVWIWGFDPSVCTVGLAGGAAGEDKEGPGGSTSAGRGNPSTATVEVDPDYDGDGFRLSDDDCNDLDPTVFPGADELADPIDHDCDGNPTPELDPDTNDTGTTQPTGDTAETNDTGPARDTGVGETIEPVLPVPKDVVRKPNPPGYALCATGPTSVVAWPALVLATLLVVRRRQRRGWSRS